MTSQLLEKQSVPSGEEDVRQYLRDIRQFPLLTPQAFLLWTWSKREVSACWRR